MMAAVLWYSPSARFSNSDATMTTPSSPASSASRSVDGPGNGLGQIEEAMVFGLAEVLAPEELLEADDLRAAGGSLAHAVERAAHVGLGVLAAARLHQAEGDLIRCRVCHGSENNGRSGPRHAVVVTGVTTGGGAP